MKPFRFGLLLEHDIASREELLATARRAQDDGYDILLGTDHLGRLSHLFLLVTAAEATKLRIGTLVLCNDFRHPALLAQDLAAIDVMTGGRLEIGIGAGWAREEYESAGLSFDRPGKRLERLKASVAIIKQALSEGRIERPAEEAYGPVQLEGMPRSEQRPHPPILIGGGGPRLLAYAAAEADIVAIDPRALPEGGHVPGDITEAIMDEKLSWIREAAGERFSQLEINHLIFGVDAAYRAGSGHTSIVSESLSLDEIERSPFYLLGEPSAMADRLIERRERWGINYVVAKRAQMDALAPVVARLAGR